MKKSLVALATLAATGAVMAQATIYGRMDVSYGVKQATFGNGGLNWKQTGLMDGLATSNAIGFEAKESIGGGMSARLVAETGLSPTNGSGMFGMRTGTAGAQLDGYAANSADVFDMGTRGAYSQAANRQTFVELEGGFGRVRAGFMRTHGYELATFSGHTFTGEGAVGGQVAHVFGLGAAGGTRGNAIEYQLPKIGNLTVGLQMGSGGGRELTEFGAGTQNLATGIASTQNTRNSLKLDWAAGAAKVGMVYTSFVSSTSGAVRQFDFDGDTATFENIATYNVFGALTGLNTAANRTGKSTFTTNLTQLAGSYDFGMVKIGANINMGSQNNSEVATSGILGTTTTAASTVDIKSQAISFMMPMGAMELAGGMGTASTSVAGVATKDQSTSQLSLRYNFSKRTAVYGLIGTAKDQTPINATSGSAVGYMTQTGLGMLTTF
ncbi:OmpC Outer membrane protein (porin) [Burkholderiaceae bacterium]